MAPTGKTVMPLLTLVGRLYGSTEFGPPNQDGIVQSVLLFMVNTDGSNFKVLHQFNRSGGANPPRGSKGHARRNDLRHYQRGRPLGK